MKNTRIRWNSILYGTVFLAFALGNQSCKKDKEEDKTEVSEEEAAETIAKSMSETSGGSLEQTEMMVSYVEELSVNDCGMSEDTTISGNGNGVITYSYNYQLTKTLTCNNNVPTTFVATLEGGNEYDAPRMASDDEVNADITIHGLESSANEWTINQSLNREGTQQSKIRNQASFNSTIELSIGNLKIRKSDHKILSGTANVSISGASSDGVSFSYSGTLTFNGDNTFTVDLGSGETYDFSW